MHVVLSLLNDRPLNSLHLEFYWSLEMGDIQTVNVHTCGKSKHVIVYYAFRGNIRNVKIDRTCIVAWT